MNTEKKINKLIKLEYKSKLTSRQLKEIVKFSGDQEPIIRSQVANLLVNYKNILSKDILLRLACDENTLVRIEAYDSLSVYDYKDVEIFLWKAMQKEKNKLACSYVILSWADVVMALGENLSEKNAQIIEIKQSPRIKQSEHCLLSCCYAIYIFGINKSINEIIDFLNSNNYHVRCATINILKSIVDSDNKEIIKKSLVDILEKEKIFAVSSSAEAFLKDLKE